MAEVRKMYVGNLRINISCIKTLQILSLSPVIRKSELFNYFKDYRPHLFHGFRNKYFNKISLDDMLYTHS